MSVRVPASPNWGRADPHLLYEGQILCEVLPLGHPNKKSFDTNLYVEVFFEILLPLVIKYPAI